MPTTLERVGGMLSKSRQGAEQYQEKREIRMRMSEYWRPEKVGINNLSGEIGCGLSNYFNIG
jgi:hypothetical protein